MTRAEAQKSVNDLYLYGKITRVEWSKRFDELSSPRWSAEGPVKLKEKSIERGVCSDVKQESKP